METEKRQETMFHQNKYPYNLLLAIRGMADREIPEVLTEDHLAGLAYVLSTLDDAAGITKPYASDEIVNRPIESLNPPTWQSQCKRNCAGD